MEAPNSHWTGDWVWLQKSSHCLDRDDAGVKNYRKITPVAAPSERMPAEEKGVALQVISSTHHLSPVCFQVALEKNFFHNQPSALRRSVDFLAERLASNVIRKVRKISCEYITDSDYLINRLSEYQFEV